MTIGSENQFSHSFHIEVLPKLLLFLSREKLTESQNDSILCMPLSDIDLNMLTVECGRRMIGPTAFSHLLDLEIIDTGDHEAIWREATRLQIMTSMKFASEMKNFHADCIEPLQVRHIYFKGPALAARYYAKPFLRQCRDIDVLVEEDRIGDVVIKAVRLGYSMADPMFGSVSHLGDEAIDAFITMSDVVTIRSPGGVVIEVHRTLDRQVQMFRNDILFSETERQNFFEKSIDVLKPELALCYIAYHSTQHTWAKLNWFADLNAILEYPSFDREECMNWARRIGIQELVASCIEIDDWCSDGAPSIADLSPGASNLFLLIRRNIGGNLATEKQLILSEHTIGLPKRFQASTAVRMRALVSHLRSSFSPDISLYCRLPLPKRFWWAYSIARPFVSIVGLFRLKLSGKGDA